MPATVSVELKGLVEAQAKMRQVVTDFGGIPAARAMESAAMLVTRAARINAPVDTGRLRASITPEIRSRRESIDGVIGSNLTYAPYMETGTGVFVGRPRHCPPPAALDLWATRHGFKSGYLVARAICRRGGLRPRRYLERAITENAARITQIFERFVGTTVRK